jgi:fumarate hydratase class II
MQTREERDTMGPVQVPAAALWGAQLVGWGEIRTPTSTKLPIVGFHFIQPNLRVVALKMKRCSAAGSHFSQPGSVIACAHVQ